jgi:DNA-binding XRE family transcriptional regulator
MTGFKQTGYISVMANRVRELRLDGQLSQGALAERAGVSRQLVSAIEADRHVPNVDAALRLASALGVTVEDLFVAPRSGGAISVRAHTDSDVASGVVVGRVGDRQVYAPLRHLLGAADHWAVADGFMGDDGLETYSDVDTEGFVVAGCDPLLGLTATLASGRSGPRIVPVHLSTGDAIDALERGVVHAVVVHGSPGSLPASPVPTRRWHVASWQVGVASARKGFDTVEALAERRPRTAQRDSGAGTQRALTRALQRVGSSALPGPIVDGHVDAARHVVAGVPAGVTMEAAARAFSLSFFPLETHTSELWIDTRYLEHRGALAFVNALTGANMITRSRRLPGYDVTSMGTLLAS